jgi:SAM-dependent methyltransferase
MIDPKERFSGRVENYVRYRPGYPAALYEMLSREFAIGAGSVVADVGSGTGILSRGLLELSARVLGIEPNAAMRAAAENELSINGRFESVDACAEATGLEAASVDLIVAAQAFHWFDPAGARAEFGRILKPNGVVALVWNQRRDTPLNLEYTGMLEAFAPEYAQVREKERAAEHKILPFFAPTKPDWAKFENQQRLDEAGLRGRLLSSSYAPPTGHPLHDLIMRRLGEIFRAHAESGFVTIEYETIVWYGGLRS